MSGSRRCRSRGPAESGARPGRAVMIAGRCEAQVDRPVYLVTALTRAFGANDRLAARRYVKYDLLRTRPPSSPLGGEDGGALSAWFTEDAEPNFPALCL